MSASISGGGLRTGGPSVAWREAGEEVVILDLERSTYFGLNAAGALLWKSLTQGSTHAELVTILVKAGAAPERSAAEVDGFLALLYGEGLLDRPRAD